MNRITKTFETLAGRGEKALVSFVSAGDPDRARSLSILRALALGGTDVLELGVPFSDPTADGPVIQRASQRALAAGMTLAGVLSLCREIRGGFPDLPVVIFSYYNPILAYGGARFYRDALAAGADGVLVVDLPPEESAELTDAWEGDGLCLIRLVAPTTPLDRMRAISAQGSGFVYLVSMTGVTGSAGLDSAAAARVTRELKSVTKLPVAVGFGVSTPEQAAVLGAEADGVVVGSAYCRMIEQGADDRAIRDFAASLKQSLK